MIEDTFTSPFFFIGGDEGTVIGTPWVDADLWDDEEIWND
jgi:hypothetical protein